MDIPYMMVIRKLDFMLFMGANESVLVIYFTANIAWLTGIAQ